MAGRDRRVKPVDVRVFFLKKASDPGTVGRDASSLVLMAISRGELGDGGVLERVVAELLFIDHRRIGIFRWAVSGRFRADTAAGLPESAPSAALSVCEPTRLRKLDMVRRKFDVERLEGGAAAGSWSGEGVAGEGVEGGPARGVSWGLRGGFDGGVAAVLTSKGGFAPGAAPCRADGKAATA